MANAIKTVLGNIALIDLSKRMIAFFMRFFSGKNEAKRGLLSYAKSHSILSAFVSDK